MSKASNGVKRVIRGTPASVTYTLPSGAKAAAARAVHPHLRQRRLRDQQPPASVYIDTGDPGDEARVRFLEADSGLELEQRVERKRRR